MMIRSKLLLLPVFVFILGLSNSLKSQSSNVILLNEYSASNVTGPNDAYGAKSDWVELYNIYTSSVSLASYYLSNDRNNLLKWKFPANFTMQAGEFKAVWLTGRNTIKNGEVHANFVIEQCKNQWLILSTSAGVVRDSIFIQPTMAGHSRGRVNATQMGINAWRLYTSNSFLFANPLVNNYIDYCPKPKMVTSPLQTPNGPKSPSEGGFYGVNGSSPIVYFKLDNNLAYDSAYSCYNIYYTTDGSFPTVGGTGTTLYPDSVNGSQGALTMAATTIVRAIAVPKGNVNCVNNYLPSFCETNTYFVDIDHNKFSPEFGVISLAMDPTWFNTSGAFSPSIHAEYYDKMVQVSEGYAQIFKPTQEEWRTKQRGMYINFNDKQGFGCAFEGNIFNVNVLGTTTRTIFPTLHLKAGDIESSSKSNNSQADVTVATGMRDVILQSLAARYNLNVSPLHVKPVITFVNGAYYGVFNLMEVYDKYYENYYNSQSMDSLTLAFYHNTDGSVNYADGTSSNFNNNFKSKVYDVATTKPMNSATFYNQLMAELDKKSFIDYMILNSYAMNSDLWNYNIGFARGGTATSPGAKWHYYLWNAPAVFNFTAIQTNTLIYSNPNISPCYVHDNASASYPGLVSPLGGNGHAVILNRLMNPVNGNKTFQQEYKNRYQDLLNGALKCENILNHFDTVQSIYQKEMNYHSDPATNPTFGTATPPDPLSWDSNMVRLRTVISNRCYVVGTYFNKNSCYSMTGPFEINVNVQPEGSGSVQLNSEVLPYYIWYGKYYSSQMSFKAIPTNTTFVFDHWELSSPQNAKNPLSADSIGFSFNQPETVVAVFTDISNDLVASGENANIPTGFTPNGDGLNDIFKPLGSADYVSNFDFTIWSRWGEEMFRSTSAQNGWDGTFKGQPAVTGVYAYVISYTNIYGENKLVKGNVTLTR